MWHFSDSLELFTERTWDLLAADPESNTIALTVIETLRAGYSWSEVPPVFAWWEPSDEAVAGAVSMTPPYGLLLSVVPPDSIELLVAGLLRQGVVVPDCHGATEVAERFAEELARREGSAAELGLRQRLYGLTELVAPSHPGGAARLARQADLGLLQQWNDDFHAEAGGHRGRSEQWAQMQVDQETACIWDDDQGEAVSLACRRPATAGVGRIGPVYTPPEHRRHGYASAVTAAATQAVLDHGAERVVLFTDLANPVSNSIYQAIGYRPLADRAEIRFVRATS